MSVAFGSRVLNMSLQRRISYLVRTSPREWARVLHVMVIRVTFRNRGNSQEERN